MWYSVQGGWWDAHSRRRPLRCVPEPAGCRLIDRGKLGAGHVVGKKDLTISTLMFVRPASPSNWINPSAHAAMHPEEPGPILNAATGYQDSPTRYWAAELWERVGRLIGDKDVWRQSWRIGELTNPRLFTDAVQAAAEADVLVISARDAGEWPMGLYDWIDAWLHRRAGREGALVALIGVPGQAGRAMRSRPPIPGDGHPRSRSGFPAAGAQAARRGVGFLQSGEGSPHG
jgi:hypothetical protein